MKVTDISRARESLAYQAPFLVEKLLKERIVETADEGQALFAEVKKYMLLARTDDVTYWDMYSRRVDEVWHQFILFTREYTDFCAEYFGGYVAHQPGIAPQSDAVGAKAASTFEGFASRYQELFGAPLPDVWYDERSITPSRRVLHDNVGNWSVHEADGMADLVDAAGNALLSVNRIAIDALSFIARTGAFYVRELPGGMTGEEQSALVATLVEFGLVRVAP